MDPMPSGSGPARFTAKAQRREGNGVNRRARKRGWRTWVALRLRVFAVRFCRMDPMPSGRSGIHPEARSRGGVGRSLRARPPCSDRSSISIDRPHAKRGIEGRATWGPPLRHSGMVGGGSESKTRNLKLSHFAYLPRLASVHCRQDCPHPDTRCQRPSRRMVCVDRT
jgi:hypothetical protein